MIKTILVSLNNIEVLDSTLAAVSALTDRYNCHVIGLYVIPSIVVYSAPYGYGSGLEYIDHNRFFKSRASEIEQVFEDFIKTNAINGEWRQVNSDGHFLSHEIIEHAREADLIVLGYEGPELANEGVGVELTAYILEESGRPVLVVPPSTPKGFKLRDVVIGWDGSREAARAVFDAIPLLQMAKKVHIVCINPKKEMSISDDFPGTELAATLDRHGINVEVEIIKTRKRIGTALLDRAMKADLLVIGAYGHSRLRENILGGVTIKTLKKMNGPVLLSN